MSEKTKRYTIDFGIKMDTLLTQLSKDLEITKSDVIKRSIALYAYLHKEVDDTDMKVSISDKEDKVIKDIIIP